MVRCREINLWGGFHSCLLTWMTLDLEFLVLDIIHTHFSINEYKSWFFELSLHWMCVQAWLFFPFLFHI